MEAVRQTRADLPAHIPLIGFAGAPFTLASYAIEGGASRNFLHTKTLMYRDAGAWDALMERLARAVVVYLNAQIAAGAQAVQLFDSWVGCLGADDYRRFVLPYVHASHRAASRPACRSSASPPAIRSSCRCWPKPARRSIGVDWRVRLDDAWQMIGHDRAIQGNLDPMALLADATELRRRADDSPRPGRRPPRPHLQPRPRRAAANAGRQRPRAGRHRARTQCPQEIVDHRDTETQRRQELQLLLAFPLCSCSVVKSFRHAQQKSHSVVQWLFEGEGVSNPGRVRRPRVAFLVEQLDELLDLLGAAHRVGADGRALSALVA